MNLLLLIVLSSFLGGILFIMGPVIGGVLTFGLVVGCLLKGVFLLNDIKKTLTATNLHSVIESEEPSSHLRDKDAYLKYLKQKENPTKL